MKRLLLSFCFLLFCLSFIYSQTELPKIYLNPKSNAVVSQSQFVDSIRFIPLDPKKGIPSPSSSMIIVTKDYFVIRPYSDTRLFLFHRNGQFIKLINYKKIGKEFGISYDENRNELVLSGRNKKYELTQKDIINIKQNAENPRNKKYFSKFIIDLNDSSLTLKKASPLATDIITSYPLYGDYYWSSEIRSDPLYKKPVNYELSIYKGDDLVKTYFPYNAREELKFLYGHESISISPTDNPYINILTRPYCDTVYKISGDSITPLYQLVVPFENILPPSLFTTRFKNEFQRDNFENKNTWALRTIYNISETKSFIKFSADYLGEYESYIYLKENRITYKTQNIKPDSTQFDLALLEDDKGMLFHNTFYQHIPASSLIEFFEDNPSIPVPPELKTFLESNPADDAPVIVVYKLKNQ